MSNIHSSGSTAQGGRLAAASSASKDQDDIAALAKGGRTNIFGFLLRLAARLPFLFIAGRWYGADALGRFAYAVLVVEFVAQLATLGLKRGLAGALAQTERPHAHVVTDAMVVTLVASLIGASLLIAFPQAMFPNSGINGLDRLLALEVIAVAGSDVALAACAYRFDVGATVRARADPKRCKKRPMPPVRPERKRLFPSKAQKPQMTKWKRPPAIGVEPMGGEPFR